MVYTSLQLLAELGSCDFNYGPGNDETITLSESSPRPSFSNQLYYTHDCAGNITAFEGSNSGTSTALTINATQGAYNNVNELTSISAGGPIRFQGTTTTPVKTAVVNLTETATVTASSSLANDTLMLVIHNSALNQAKVIKYIVQANGESASTIAAGLAHNINYDATSPTLASLGISATSSGPVVTITSTSMNATTYGQAVSPGAETIALSGSREVLATLSSTKAYSANPVLAGSSTVDITTTAVVPAIGTGTTPGVGTSQAITIPHVATKSFTYDYNGNMTGDGTNTYEWDAENRLISIVYPGSGNHSDFVYDGLGRRVTISETVSGSTSATQFIWCGSQICESRNGTGGSSVVSQFFPLGQRSGGTNYYYQFNHRGDVVGVYAGTNEVNSTSYDPYGIPTALVSTFAPDFGYAGMYQHARSGLNLTMYRAYAPSLGRWISRDPIGETGGLNLYAYGLNDPLSFTDPLGLNCESSKLPHGRKRDKLIGQVSQHLGKALVVAVARGNSSVKVLGLQGTGAIMGLGMNFVAPKALAGNIIDKLWKEEIMKDPFLIQYVEITPTNGGAGVDVYSPALDWWWDLMPDEDNPKKPHEHFQQHDDKYTNGKGTVGNFGEGGIPLYYTYEHQWENH